MKKQFVLLIIGALLLLTACSSKSGQQVSDWFTSDNTKARIITKGAISTYLLHNKRAVDPVIRLTEEALSLLKLGEIVTIDQLDAYVRKKILPYLKDMTPDGQAAALLVVSEIKTQLLQQLPAQGVRDPGKMELVMETFLLWIRDAAHEVATLTDPKPFESGAGL